MSRFTDCVVRVLEKYGSKAENKKMIEKLNSFKDDNSARQYYDNVVEPEMERRMLGYTKNNVQINDTIDVIVKKDPNVKNVSIAQRLKYLAEDNLNYLQGHFSFKARIDMNETSVYRNMYELLDSQRPGRVLSSRRNKRIRHSFANGLFDANTKDVNARKLAAGLDDQKVEYINEVKKSGGDPDPNWGWKLGDGLPLQKDILKIRNANRDEWIAAVSKATGNDPVSIKAAEDLYSLATRTKGSRGGRKAEGLAGAGDLGVGMKDNLLGEGTDLTKNIKIKDYDSWLELNDKFGVNDSGDRAVMNTVEGLVSRMSTELAAIQTFGHSYRYQIPNLIKRVETLAKINGEKIVRHEITEAENTMSNLMFQNTTPESAALAYYTRGLSNIVQNSLLLFTALDSHIGDAIFSVQGRYVNKPLSKSTKENVVSAFKNIPQAAFAPITRFLYAAVDLINIEGKLGKTKLNTAKELWLELGGDIGHFLQRNNAANRFDVDSVNTGQGVKKWKPSYLFHRGAEFSNFWMYKMSGLIDSIHNNRAVEALEFNRMIAEGIPKGIDPKNVSKEVKDIISPYGFNDTDISILSQANRKKEGYVYRETFDLDEIYDAGGRVRETARKMWNMTQRRDAVSVPMPDARTQANIIGKTQQGTLSRTGRTALGMLKSFPIIRMKNNWYKIRQKYIQQGSTITEGSRLKGEAAVLVDSILVGGGIYWLWMIFQKMTRDAANGHEIDIENYFPWNIAENEVALNNTLWAVSRTSTIPGVPELAIDPYRRGAFDNKFSFKAHTADFTAGPMTMKTYDIFKDTFDIFTDEDMLSQEKAAKFSGAVSHFLPNLWFQSFLGLPRRDEAVATLLDETGINELIFGDDDIAGFIRDQNEDRIYRQGGTPAD